MVNSADNAYQYVDIGVQTSPRKHVSEARPEHNDIPSARDEPHPESEVERTKKYAKSWIASTRQNDEQSSRAVSHPMPLEGLSVSKINMKSTFYVDGRQSGLESGEISTQRSVSSPGNIGFRVRRSTRASALDIPFRLQSSTNSTDSDDIHTSGSVVYHDSLDTSLTFRTCSPSSSSDSDSIEIIGNQPLSPSLLRNQEKEPGHSQVSFSDPPLIQSGDDGWLQWAHSPPRPIPALHGPLSLPYARCPSGAEGTLLTEPTNVNRVVWGLDEGDRPHLAHSHHADRAPSYTQQHHRWHSRDASQKNIPMSSRKITRTDEMNPVLQNSRQNHGLALLHPAQISHSKRDPSDGKENSVPSDWASAPAFVPKWTSSPTFDSHTTLSTPQFDHSPELSSSIASHSPNTPFLSPSLPSLGPISLSESVINEYLRLDQQYKNVRRQQEILAHRSGPSQLTTPPLSSPTIWNLPFSSEAAHLIATDEQLHDFRDGNPLLTPFAQYMPSPTLSDPLQMSEELRKLLLQRLHLSNGIIANEPGSLLPSLTDANSWSPNPSTHAHVSSGKDRPSPGLRPSMISSNWRAPRDAAQRPHSKDAFSDNVTNARVPQPSGLLHSRLPSLKAMQKPTLAPVPEEDDADVSRRPAKVQLPKSTPLDSVESPFYIVNGPSPSLPDVHHIVSNQQPLQVKLPAARSSTPQYRDNKNRRKTREVRSSASDHLLIH